MKDRLTVGYFASGEVRLEFAASLNAAIVHLANQGVKVRQQPHVSGPRIAGARNHQVATFLQSDSQWMFMVDSDMVFPANAISRLLEAAHPKKAPIVGGLTWGKGREGIFPTIYHWRGQGFGRSEAWEPDTLVPADGTGAACLLVHRSVFEEMAEHFKPPNVWFEETVVPGTINPMGEDLTFCLRARSIEKPIFIHTGVQFGHIKSFEMNEKFYIDWCRTNRLLVTGTGYCDLDWVSHVLQAVKLPADYERFFNPQHRQLLDWGRADVSWMAAPFLREYREAFKLHLVRDPLKVVARFTEERFFADDCPEELAPYQDFAREFCPEAFDPEDLVESAAVFYVRWNEMIDEHAVQRLRVEDQVTGPNLFPAVEATDNRHQAWEIQAAINTLPHPPDEPVMQLGWDDIPSSIRPELESMAERYGYDT